MIPFSPPRIDSKIIDAVIDTLNSGWITTGPKTKLFEKKLTEFCGSKSTLCVSSASAGLELMLHWYGVGIGDEVILPAYTYAATANVIKHTGATPIFVDIKGDFNIDVNKIRNAINSKTKVIMPVDIAGWPCDYEAINKLVKQTEITKMFIANGNKQHALGRILILSDGAHSLGASFKGHQTGSLTDVTVFSFHAVKNLTTAEGGAVALNLPEPFDNNIIYTELNMKSLHGQSKDALAKTQIGNWRYDILEAGYKYNMTDIQASMGLVELDRYKDDMLVRRRQIFDLYSKLLGKYSWALLPEYFNNERISSFHVFLLRINGASETKRDDIISEIFSRNVSVNVHFVPLPMMTYYQNLGYTIKDFPKSYELYQNEISLPVYYNLTDSQVEEVVRAVAEAVLAVQKK